MPIGSTNLGMGIVFTLHDKVTPTAKKIDSSFSRMQSNAEKASMRVSESFSKITSGFLNLALSSAGILLPFGAAINKSAEFEAAMSDVQAKSNATSIELSQLREQALKLSSAQSTANFTAKQVAEGQKFLAQAGLNTKQIMDAIQPSLLLASAGTLGLGEAADIATNTMSQFGLSASEMSRVTDVIANAASSSNQNVRQFADGMKFFGPTARALKVDLEEAASAMMVLANSGLQGSLGTRALGTSLAGRLTKPTKLAAKAMDELGFEAFDTSGKFVGIEGLVRRLDKSLTGLTDKQKQAAIATIFGGESIQEVNTLLTAQVEVMQNGTKVILKGADAIAHFTQKNREAAGTADRIAKTQLNNLKGSFTVLASTMESILIRVGSALTPLVRPIVDSLSSLLSTFSSFLSTKLGKRLSIISAGIALVTVAIIALNFAVNTLRPSLINIARSSIAAIAPLMPMIALLGALSAAIILVNKGINDFSKFMKDGKDATSSFGKFTVRLGAIVSGIIKIFKTWNGETFTITSTFKHALQKLGIFEFFLKLSTVIVRFIEFWKGFASGFVSTLTSMWSVVKPILMSIGDAILGLFGGFDKLTSATEKWAKAGKVLGKIIGGVLILMVTKLTASLFVLAFKAVGSVIANIASMGIAFISVAVKAVAALISSVSTLVVTFGLLALKIIIVVGVIALIGYALKKLWDFLVDNEVFKKFGEALGSAFDYVAERASAMWDFIKSLPKRFIKWGVNVGQAIKDGIITAIKALGGFLTSALTTILGEDLGMEVSAALGLKEEPVKNQIEDFRTGLPPLNSPVDNLSNQALQINAMRFGVPPATVIQNTERVTKSVDVTLVLDSESIAQKMVEIEIEDDARQ